MTTISSAAIGARWMTDVTGLLPAGVTSRYRFLDQHLVRVARPRLTSVRTIPLGDDDLSDLRFWSLTTTSLVLSAADPSRREGEPNSCPSSGVVLTTVPRTTTVLSLSAALPVTISADGSRVGAGAFATLTSPMVASLRHAGVHRTRAPVRGCAGCRCPARAGF
jgi:hypothetical protein